jgi:type IV secretion system protein VirD4
MAWLQWHHAHAYYIWGGMAGLAVAGRVVRRLHRRETQEPDAQWATLKGIRKVHLDGAAGIVIGQWDRYVLRYEGEGHLLVIARPRTGKSSSMLVPTLLEPQAQKSFIVNDPKSELYRMTRRYQESLGRRVYHLDATSTVSDHYNPFDVLRLGTVHEGGDLRVLARMMSNPEDKSTKDTNEAFWEGVVADASQGLIVFGVLTGRATNPGMFYEFLGQTTLGDLIVDLPGTGHQRCEQVARTLQEMTESQQKSVITNIRKNFAIYSDELLARMTSRSDFHPDDLRTGSEPCTLYVSVPFEEEDLLNVNRLILRQLLRHATRVSPTPSTTRRTQHGWDYDVDILTDEGQSLKNMSLFPALLDYGAGFGVRILFVTPSLNRLEAIYGKNNFLESTAVQVYFGIVDEKVAERIETRLGTRAVTQTRVTKGRGGVSRTTETVRKPLLDVSAILHLDDSELIVFADKEQLRVRQLPWYAYDPWKARGDSLQ